MTGSRAEPEASLLCRLVSEAHKEITLTGQVTSERFATGNEEVRGLQDL